MVNESEKEKNNPLSIAKEVNGLKLLDDKLQFSNGQNYLKKHTSIQEILDK